MIHFPVPEPVLAAIDETRADETRADWILGAIGLRLSPLPEVIAEVIPPDMVPPGLTSVTRPALVHHGDRITGERHASRCLDWKDGDRSSRAALDITCVACQNEVFP